MLLIYIFLFCKALLISKCKLALYKLLNYHYYYCYYYYVAVWNFGMLSTLWVKCYIKLYIKILLLLLLLLLLVVENHHPRMQNIYFRLTGVAQKRLLIFGSSTVPGACVFVACLSVSKLYFMDSKRLKGLKFIFLNFYYFVALTIVYIDLFRFCYNQIALSQCDFFTSMPC